jgi:diacylglycerol kinase (ATP)
MARKIIYLINPISGTQKKDQLSQLIARKTRALNIDFEILTSNADGIYTNLQKKIQKETVTDVVICGGDGTINAVINALQGIDVNIGIIPMGSGNGLAFAAKIPKQPSAALEIIFKNKSSHTDAFYINDKFSCMLCGIGFDALVAQEFAKQKTRGLQTYVRISTQQFFKAKPYQFEIKLKDQIVKTEAYFISIANSNQFGNNFKIAPNASMSDGLLDIVVVKKMSKLNLPFAVLFQVSGNNKPEFHMDYGDKKNILYLQTDKISIRNPDQAPLHIDGDPAETSTAFKVRIVPNCFKLLQP